MKIVHVIGALIAGGAERFVVALLEQLTVHGADVSLWTLSNRRDAAGDESMTRLVHAGIDCQSGPSARVAWRSVAWYARTIERARPDIVHLHTPNTELAHYLIRIFGMKRHGRNRPTVIRTIHNTELPSGALIRRAYRSNPAACSIACGHAVEVAYRGVIGGAMRHISNGVSFTSSAVSQEGRAAVLQCLGLEPDKTHFVNVGRMSGASLGVAQKGHDILLDAWRQSGLGQRVGVLHLLGDGNLREDLVRRAGGDPSIRFHGVRSDVDAWLRAADCFVLPSRFEGLPISGIEAVGAGLPCIFSDIASLRELSAPCVAWCEVNDVDSLARQLTLMVERRLRPSIDETGRFRERYSIERTAREYLDVYRQYGSTV